MDFNGSNKIGNGLVKTQSVVFGSQSNLHAAKEDPEAETQPNSKHQSVVVQSSFLQKPNHSRSIGHSQVFEDKLEAAFVPAPGQSQLSRVAGKGSLTSRQGSMSHRDSVPIGPQKSKNQ
jgi:hypothetical protein